MNVCVTCDNGGNAPADGIVESHGTIVDVALLGLHAVDMKAFHEHPGKCGHEEVVQEDRDNCTQELDGEIKRRIKAQKEKKNKRSRRKMEIAEIKGERWFMDKKKEKRKKSKDREEKEGMKEWRGRSKREMV